MTAKSIGLEKKRRIIYYTECVDNNKNMKIITLPLRDINGMYFLKKIISATQEDEHL